MGCRGLGQPSAAQALLGLVFRFLLSLLCLSLSTSVAALWDFDGWMSSNYLCDYSGSATTQLLSKTVDEILMKVAGVSGSGAMWKSRQVVLLAEVAGSVFPCDCSEIATSQLFSKTVDEILMKVAGRSGLVAFWHSVFLFLFSPTSVAALQDFDGWMGSYYQCDCSETAATLLFFKTVEGILMKVAGVLGSAALWKSCQVVLLGLQVQIFPVIVVKSLPHNSFPRR